MQSTIETAEAAHRSGYITAVTDALALVIQGKATVAEISRLSDKIPASPAIEQMKAQLEAMPE